MKKRNVAIVTFPFPTSEAAANIPVSNFVNIIIPLSKHLYLITGSGGHRLFEDNREVYVHKIEHVRSANTFTRVLRYIWVELKISYNLIKISKNVDIWIFYLGCGTLLLPMIIAKLSGKKVISALEASSLQCARSANDNLSKPIAILESINRSFADIIILYSPILIKEWDLEKYRHKISIAHHHFLDFDKFKMQKSLNNRDNLIGYIGRLSEEKGTLNFVKAIPQIINEKTDLELLIGGDGSLRDEIEKYLRNENLNNKVTLAGWILHDQLPDHMNKLKLIILPSYTEGLPNIMLEAMACGTPVLATPVGAISDVIQDGETGFIMENNSPECIATNVIRALNHSNLEQIAKNARTLIEKEYTYEKAVEKYRKIFEDLK